MRIPPSTPQQNVSHANGASTNGTSANGTSAGTGNGALPAHFEGAVNGPVPDGAQAVAQPNAGQPNGVGIDHQGGVASQPEQTPSLAVVAAQMSLQRAQAVLDRLDM